MSTSSFHSSGPLSAAFDAAAAAHRAAREGKVPTAARTTAFNPDTPVEAAIAQAARATSVDFNFLLAQAQVESAMDPDARAPTSSATGLYQFIDSTWLSTVKKHGGRFGLGHIADQVGDPARRAEILALRSDPQIASLMAAGLAEDNRAHLAPILGREPDHSELYLAHFLGAGGAGRFLSEMQTDPSQSAAALFARPAAANRAIFYAPDGRPRSLAQVMDVIESKLARALDRASDGQAVQFARADAAPAAASFASAYQPAGTRPQLALAAAPAARTARAPMSQVLGAAFGGDPAAAPAQVRRAYAKLQAFGL